MVCHMFKKLLKNIAGFSVNMWQLRFPHQLEIQMKENKPIIKTNPRCLIKVRTGKFEFS